ncbi:hypothetical protein [Streptomyces sp. MMBL 11-3]|uniref:hypothetical protein n=1 Tax=Streptomyces sp. MMBL 11-3 TaxID=3382639 RepID=UPI0039B49B68
MRAESDQTRHDTNVSEPPIRQLFRDEEHLHRRVLSFSCVVVDPLDTAPSTTVGTMIRDGYGGADTCHALYCALPRAEFTGMSILLTEHEDHHPPGVVTVGIDTPSMLGFN